MSDAPRVWALLGHRTGDNNQVLALAEELGFPFETRSLRYNLLRALEGDFLGPTLISLERATRRHILEPWPDLLIAIGRRSVPIARYVRKKSGGRCKLVLIGHPRVDPRDFDLVITTRQYPVPRHDNVLLLPMAMSRIRQAPAVEPDESEWLQRLPRPHLLLALGGSTKYHDLVPERMSEAATELASRADDFGGTLMAVGSPRTQPEVLQAIEQALVGSTHRLITGKRPRFQVLLNNADELFVTADSMSMMSEAILTGRPVGMVPVTLNSTGRDWLGENGQPGKGKGRLRDMSRIWQHLSENRLIGTLGQPLASSVENPVIEAAAAVRRLLDR
jgi:mitochondrial fission protein ELM1